MYVDTARPGPASSAAERAGKRLVTALQDMVGGCADLLALEERAWASATFSGARHTVTLRFTGAEDCETADIFVEVLPEHEFGLPGLLVADAQVRAVTYDCLPQPSMTVEAELLVLNED